MQREGRNRPALGLGTVKPKLDFLGSETSQVCADEQGGVKAASWLSAWLLGRVRPTAFSAELVTDEHTLLHQGACIFLFFYLVRWKQKRNGKCVGIVL